MLQANHVPVNFEIVSCGIKRKKDFALFLALFFFTLALLLYSSPRKLDGNVQRFSKTLRKAKRKFEKLPDF